MDKLLSTFTVQHINTFDNNQLIYLCDLLDIDDENLYKFNQGKKTSIKIEKNSVTELFKNYSYIAG